MKHSPLDKMAVALLVKKCPAFYVSRRFTAVFTRALYMVAILSQKNPVHTLTPDFL
jgi:hypothetical protein